MENKKSPTRTFFILHRETILEAPPRFELGIKVLQTFALPLGYSAETPFFYGWGSRKKQRELL